MDKLREILEDLCHNTMGNPKYRIDHAHSAIIALFLERLPSEEDIDFLCNKLSDEYSTDKTDPITQDIFKDSKRAITRFIADCRERIKGE